MLSNQDPDPLRAVVPSPVMRKARIAVSVVFVCFGMVLAIWAVQLPSLQRATGISTAMLGTVLLTHGVGAVLGMQVCGPLTDRWGAARLTSISMALTALAALLPLSADTLGWALAGALVFGIATGGADVCMQAKAIEIQRGYGRPILSSCHAMFSIGNVFGAAAGSIGIALEMTTSMITGCVAGISLVALGVTAHWLYRATVPPPASVGPATPSASRAPGPTARRLLVLGAMAFLLLLCEGVAMDWSSLHAQQNFGASPAQGAMVFGAFVSAMTVGRLCADRVVDRIGPVPLVRYGSALMVVGMGIVIAVPTLWIAVVGWLLFGIGLAGCVPQIFTAAADVGPAAGRALARVVGMGYFALLAGPALVGWVAEVTTLNFAFGIALAAGAVCVVAANTAGPQK